MFLFSEFRFVIVHSICDCALVMINICDCPGHASRGAFFRAAPVNFLVVPFVADVWKAVDDHFWIAALAGNETKFPGCLGRSFVIILMRDFSTFRGVDNDFDDLKEIKLLLIKFKWQKNFI